MDEDEKIYALRIRRRALLDMQEALLRLAELVDDEYAVSWFSDLEDTLAKLATLPRRWPVAPENHLFGQEIRALSYRHGFRTPAYRILFTIVEEEDDGPTVYILNVRHGARKPITRAEARQIEADD